LGSKIDNGEFLKYSLSSNVWAVTDKKGTVYKFGTNAAERQDDPNDSTHVYKWMLQEVRDTNNNYIKYEYSKDGGQIYPYKITYTGNNTTDGIFVIEFLKNSRSDVIKSYKTGFLITTSYKIYEIQAKINGTWARKYALAYANADNGRRVVLNTITESGQDESSNVVALPVVDYDYQTTMSNSSWTSGSITYPADLTQSIVVDANGDGYPDVMRSWSSQGTDYKTTYLNNGDGTFTSNSNYAPPTIFYLSTINGNQDQGVRAVDVNGDGLVDLVLANESSTTTWLNNGNGWTTSSTWNSPMPFTNRNSPTDGASTAELADVNGDGLVDIIRAYWNGTFNSDVYLNNGAGWTRNSNWSIPSGITSSLRKGVIIADVNNDGLADILQSYCNGPGCTVVRSAYINNGSNGWTSDSNWLPPSSYTFYTESGTDPGIRLVDYNSDGLPDFIQRIDYTNGSHLITNYYNNGNGWTSGTSIWDSQLPFSTNSTGDMGTRIADINGDGMPDTIRTSYSGGPMISETYFNNKKTADALSRINYPEGGYTDITYKATPKYLSGSTILNPKLPIALNTVETITNNDGLGTSDSITYKYESGEYYFNNSFDRRLAGFNKISITDANGNIKKNYYHQGDSTDSSNGEYSDDISKLGKIYRAEVSNSSGNIYSKTINKWDKYDLGNSRNFVKLIQKIEMSHDGGSNHKDKAETYTYNNTYGNLTQKVELGEVTGADAGTYTDTGTDDFTTDYAYASNTTPYIMALLDDVTVTDHSSTKVKEDKYYYDAQSLGTVNIGNQTKHEMWKVSTTYINTQKTFDGTYGLVTVDTDLRGKTTSYSYDTYHLYPTAVTNALSQQTNYTYDYSFGKLNKKLILTLEYFNGSTMV
jgi:hypothetical protein